MAIIRFHTLKLLTKRLRTKSYAKISVNPKRNKKSSSDKNHKVSQFKSISIIIRNFHKKTSRSLTLKPDFIHNSSFKLFVCHGRRKTKYFHAYLPFHHIDTFLNTFFHEYCLLNKEKGFVWILLCLSFFLW